MSQEADVNTQALEEAKSELTELRRQLQGLDIERQTLQKTVRQSLFASQLLVIGCEFHFQGSPGNSSSAWKANKYGHKTDNPQLVFQINNKQAYLIDSMYLR